MSYDYLEGFEKIEIDPKKLLTNIKIKNVFYFSHNPKVVSSSLTPATTEMPLLKQFTEDFLLLGKIHLRPLKTVKKH